MTAIRTREEIDAEKQNKPRPDLLPATALGALWRAMPSTPPLHDGAEIYQLWLFFRADPTAQNLIAAMLGLATQLGGVPAAINYGGHVMGYGFRKHGACTWRIACTMQSQPQTHVASAERHLLEYLQDPAEREEGSGFPVLWHAFAQMCIVFDLLADPPKKPQINDGHVMIAQFQEES